MMIRDYRPADRQEMTTLFREFYTSSAVLHPVPYSYFEATLDAAGAGSPYIGLHLIEAEGKIAGYGLLSLSWSNEAGGVVVWIDEVYIRPPFQGCGLGAEYLTFVEHAFPQARRLRLEVEPDNEGAVRLYRRFGFERLEYDQYVKEKSPCSLR